MVTKNWPPKTKNVGELSPRRTSEELSRTCVGVPITKLDTIFQREPSSSRLRGKEAPHSRSSMQVKTSVDITEVGTRQVGNAAKPVPQCAAVDM